jgi:hypothetical protein
MVFKRILIAIALLVAFAGTTFSGTAMAETPEFYKSAIQMGTSQCPDVSFDCERLTSNQSQIIDAANQCVTSRMGVRSRIMSDFQSSGEHENCVLSGQPEKNSAGTSVWVICCVKKEANSETCGMSCTRYIDQK